MKLPKTVLISNLGFGPDAMALACNPSYVKGVSKRIAGQGTPGKKCWGHGSNSREPAHHA
jgi:hypothetical protein